MQGFRNLKVWEKAHVRTLEVYKASKSFPRDEIYGLTSQMRRAAVSVGANIAEGSCRKGDADFARFLQMLRARPANWSTTCFLPEIWSCCKPRNISGFQMAQSR
jgi:hypothetical protein